MKEVVLNPEQIIVPGEYNLANEAILKIYFRCFDRGYGKDLPQVVVTGNDISPMDLNPGIIYQRKIDFIKDCEQKGILPIHELDGEKFYRYEKDNYPMVSRKGSKKCFDDEIKDEYSEILKKNKRMRREGARYLLLDGCHRSASAALTHNSIRGLELESDGDITKLRKMVEKGELFEFKRNETSLSELVASFYEFCSNRVENFETVKSRIEMLTNNKDIPKYMIDRYLRS